MVSTKVGFVGLGDIGAPMAMRVLQAGFDLHVYNRTASKVEPFVDAGATACSSPLALANACDVILICVTDQAAVEEVVFGKQGVARASEGAKVVVDLSTISPDQTRRFAERLATDARMRWVDAPVSGGPQGAEQGTLAVMVGAASEDFDQVRGILESFGRQVTLMGPVGAGQATKACNQMIHLVNATVIAEAMNLAHRNGVDATLLPRALAGGVADSNLLRTHGERLASGQYAGKTLNALKDLDIILEQGQRTGTPLPLTSLVASIFRLVVAKGHTGDGLGAPVRYFTKPL